MLCLKNVKYIDNSKIVVQLATKGSCYLTNSNRLSDLDISSEETMGSREEKISLYKLIGLGDQKIEETLKNEPLSNLLVQIINHVLVVDSIELTFLFAVV